MKSWVVAGGHGKWQDGAMPKKKSAKKRPKKKPAPKLDMNQLAARIVKQVSDQG